MVSILQPGEKRTVQKFALPLIILKKVVIRKTIKSNRLLKNYKVLLFDVACKLRYKQRDKGAQCCFPAVCDLALTRRLIRLLFNYLH